jgi:hypothetical protein
LLGKRPTPKSVLYDVYKLPVDKVARFFVLDERNWREYLAGADAFSPAAHARLQAKQRELLNTLRNSP